jgi:hypothetical protein
MHTEYLDRNKDKGILLHKIYPQLFVGKLKGQNYVLLNTTSSSSKDLATVQPFNEILNVFKKQNRNSW